MMTMKRLMTATLLAGGATLALAAQPSAEIAALQADCAASYSSAYAKPGAANEYQFVYAKGQLKGEVQAGKTLACTEGQYAAYLDKADPVRVMNAYPTAAGRPTAKSAK